jgi:hypothetical protein
MLTRSNEDTKKNENKSARSAKQTGNAPSVQTGIFFVSSLLRVTIPSSFSASSAAPRARFLLCPYNKSPPQALAVVPWAL